MSLLHIVFDQPCIPPNTGNAIRLSAATGAHLHVAGPLGFNFEDKNLRRAGLDYHDLAVLSVHENLADVFTSLPHGRVFAFSSHGTTNYADISYQRGDILLFGPEPTGLSEEALHHPRITDIVRIPMLAGRRSLNLANAAAIATFEAWRQFGFEGAAES
ncbi:tRNA (cytidine(34)-2'-O)-methyltransferase [Corynebacterium sp. ES2794-CONJ1]|uniref:tRNA (cytidine(34)-2'-O)-methyltransferase n=1 Tax=unclassified Corynebacterium TaxID=2624378 RepID=UPI002167367A|nr:MULTISPECIES: tRNA (cytidine(34)-2'-O)-methyltransferase [unclassified Corynebacterium]MCS4489542.1 tRNA (cytidine(34)-2'-O)-methyltransferase [Corynebacterium sp. ES2775-CONJ]MCS4491447.1 tRNA (cytidine(34)-2'-O)-methyltransferase [Corynebacterium sp. ES2715-CONJ3]MCS4531452.1 tRNA (cytidine(34)-2'-O)-methyltransferase [Corynebacterium sp. ES2730-CONJ]MCU9518840.1 tRNA (cytidine(34)-2'-O)-methyltransferase [Corynebacterium sp. ES2794-CONJ1]